MPSVEQLVSEFAEGLPRGVAVAAARSVVEVERAAILSGAGAVEPAVLVRRARAQAHRLADPGLRRVVNATGVILHTNLGRAPLAPSAAEAARAVAVSYSDLEFDLESGVRGARDDHVEDLLVSLSGAEAATAVNNNAAAVVLALAAHAGQGEVVVSRGQLVEIGGTFRIPEIIASSGAKLVEVGTTNRTRLSDYECAIGSATRALLRVHPSNFEISGFTEDVSLAHLCALGAERGLAVVDDIGSGALKPLGNEPIIRASIAAGADLVCCSADKLLGGPQAGLLMGRAAAVAACRSHPFARALRLDKMQLAALTETLRLHRDGYADRVPAVVMLNAAEDDLARRAQAIADAAGDSARVGRAAARPGGGTFPAVELPGPVCCVNPGPRGADDLVARLRRGTVPVIARIADGDVVLDPRTMSDAETEVAADALVLALAEEKDGTDAP